MKAGAGVGPRRGFGWKSAGQLEAPEGCLDGVEWLVRICFERGRSLKPLASGCLRSRGGNHNQSTRRNARRQAGIGHGIAWKKLIKVRYGINLAPCRPVQLPGQYSLM